MTEWKSDIASRLETTENGLKSLTDIRKLENDGDFDHSVQKLKTLFESYKATLLGEVIPAIETGKKAEALALIYSVQLGRYKEMLQVLAVTIKASEAGAAKGMVDSRANYSTGNIISASVGLFVLLFGGLLIIAMYYQIARPLRRIGRCYSKGHQR